MPLLESLQCIGQAQLLREKLVLELRNGFMCALAKPVNNFSVLEKSCVHLAGKTISLSFKHFSRQSVKERGRQFFNQRTKYNFQK